ncbi:MAG: 4-alpha-glucanotransferase [Zetaproteobacteria bacterium]|nr:MAG: 4-alpha-glucanotransferase [Zetaproteobacteria bacterium]
MSSWLDRRRAGLLLHVTALPGPGPNGTIGAQAHRFLETMRSGGFTVWQFLPLGPTHHHGSPYESLSSFAGNPRLIDLAWCAQQGWLPSTTPLTVNSLDEHVQQLAQAADAFWQQLADDDALAAKMDAFRRAHAYWLDDFALFSTIKAHFEDAPWWQWPDPLRWRDPEALAQIRRRHQTHYQRVIFEQFAFAMQWQELKQHAEDLGMLLFGDLPIYVAHDSADVWARPDLFTLDAQGRCAQVAGVPPDYFSATGQRWGNPLYRWEKMAKEDFRWWKHRMRCQLERMHLVRIDHFRGLESYWAIPGDRMDGIVGEWLPAPGAQLLSELRATFGQLPLVAEDLGIITDEVIRLRDAFGLPGMKILQFAFDGHADNPYLPHAHGENCVVYTGTHDNDTTVGWFASLDAASRARVLDYLGCGAEDMPWALIECALASTARLAVIPMQDLLGLGSEARFNTPGTTHGNWKWRMQHLPSHNAAIWQRSCALNRQYGRLVAPD